MDKLLPRNGIKERYIITGASSPLGIALYKSLLKNDVFCTLIVRAKRKLKGLKAFDKSLYKVIEIDLACHKDIKALCAEILELKNSPTSFVHLAASALQDEFDLEKISYAFTINVFSAWTLAKACMQKMSENFGGRILFVGSVGHKFGGTYRHPSYSSSKFLLEYFPKYFRQSAENNILVNTLRLGVMRGGTQTQKQLKSNEIERRIKLIPTGKYVTHKEVVRNILFLCSFENESVHNTVLSISGGE